MKESELQQRLDAARKEISASNEMTAVARTAAQIQEVVTGLRAAGMDIRLAIRAGDHGCQVRTEPDTQVLANGEIFLGQVVLPFLWRTDKYGSLVLDLRNSKAGGNCRYVGDSSDVRQLFTDMIVRKQAAMDMLGAFNVGMERRSDLALDKPLSLSPPLKLKKPEAP